MNASISVAFCFSTCYLSPIVVVKQLSNLVRNGLQRVVGYILWIESETSPASSGSESFSPAGGASFEVCGNSRELHLGGRQASAERTQPLFHLAPCVYCYAIT